MLAAWIGRGGPLSSPIGQPDDEAPRSREAPSGLDVHGPIPLRLWTLVGRLRPAAARSTAVRAAAPRDRRGIAAGRPRVGVPPVWDAHRDRAFARGEAPHSVHPDREPPEHVRYSDPGSAFLQQLSEVRFKARARALDSQHLLQPASRWERVD